MFDDDANLDAFEYKWMIECDCWCDRKNDDDNDDDDDDGIDAA